MRIANQTVPQQNSDVKTLLASPDWQQLIQAKYPGCDLTFWQRRRQAILTAKPKRTRCTRRTTKRNHRASNVLSGAETQTHQRNGATLELVTRANTDDIKIDALFEEFTFASGPTYYAECPDCGMVIEEDDFCPECSIPWQSQSYQAPIITEADTYGLEARA